METNKIKRTVEEFSAKHQLNEAQKQVMKDVADHQLVIVWGPPGAGKTHTVIVVSDMMATVEQ